MKAYGSENQKYFWRDEEFGPSTKFRKITSKNRNEWRRRLHKKGRANCRQDLFYQLKDLV